MVAQLAPEETVAAEEQTGLGDAWVTIVWNDPVNLMSYVSYVFRTHFGYSREKADRLMLDVHELGRAVVSSGTREQMERQGGEPTTSTPFARSTSAIEQPSAGWRSSLASSRKSLRLRR